MVNTVAAGTDRRDRGRSMKRAIWLGGIMVLVVTVLWRMVLAQETGLMGRWPVDEGAGTNTVDVSGNDNHGQLIGDPVPVWTSGVSSNALLFDGAQNEVQVPDAPALSPANALTIAVWVKAATNLTSEAVAKWSTTTNAGSYLLSLTNGLPKLELMLGGTYTSVVGQTSLSSTNWHLLAGTYDGSTMKVYLDGVLAGWSAVTGTVDVVSDPLRFGLLAGQLDDIRLYNTALTVTNLFALWYADSDGDGFPDFYEADAGTNPNDPSSYPSVVSTGAVYRAVSSVQTAPTGTCSQTKTYDNHISLNQAGVGAGGTINGYLESDDFDFEPTPGNFEVMINSARFDDEGSIAGIDSYGPSTSCGRPNELANELIDPNQVTIVGKRLRVNVSATDDADCAIEIGWYNVSITWKAWVSNTVTLVDAQGFQPQWNGTNATLQTPITDTVSGYDRTGALTDGASLIVVQLSTNPCSYDGWTVGVVDSTPGSTNGAAQLGSLHHGSSSSLPQLPATLASPGNTNLTLGADETAIFYRPPPSWAFGKGSKDHNIQLELKDQNGTTVTTKTLILHKPPLVLVHGLFGNQSGWNGFRNRITAAQFVADITTADYGTQNTAGFDSIYAAVPQAIRTAVGQRRADGIAATRVDVVAHSMGTDATRWYMTPSANLSANTDRSNNSVEPLLFKTPAIIAGRAAQDEFKRANNFGIGDIRRFVTLGGVHTGTSICWQGIRMVNNGIRAEHTLERRKEHLQVWSAVEQKFNFQAIALDEPGNPTSAGMALVDLAARKHDFPNGGVPARSVALVALAPVPVPYAPVEGVASGGSPLSTIEAGLFRIFSTFIGGGYPEDVVAANSDMCVPSLSARNLNSQNSDRTLNGIDHWNLTDNSQLDPTFFERFFGADEDAFIRP